MAPFSSPTAQATLAVHDARPDHIPAIQALYAHYVQHSVCTMEELPPSTVEMHQRHDALRRQGLPWLVALDPAGTVLGFAYAGRYRARVGYAGTVENAVYVHPEQQGRGIGQHLLAALLAECRAQGLRQMIAVIVRDEATTGSVRLHERLGFRPAGVLEQVGRKFGRDIDTLLLQCRLADAQAAA